MFIGNLSHCLHNDHKGKIKKNFKNQSITVALIKLKEMTEQIFKIVRKYYE